MHCNLPLAEASAFRADWVIGNSANNAIQVNENHAVWVSLLECKLLQAKRQDPAFSIFRAIPGFRNAPCSIFWNLPAACVVNVHFVFLINIYHRTSCSCLQHARFVFRRPRVQSSALGPVFVSHSRQKPE